MHAEPSPDGDHLITAARGSLDAFGQLLERHRPYIALLARQQIGRRLQGKADPADMVQEVFLEAHSHFDRFQGQTELVFLAWLRKILAGRVAKLVRRYGGTQARDVDLERSLEVEIDSSARFLDSGLIGSRSTPSAAAARREQSARLAELLDRLPPDYREVLILRQFEELPFQEVARRMGRSVDAVQKLWVRGLHRLRRLVEGEA
jgi:RNA polymerase sigma-70 factor (ECF subfamily)